VDSESSLTMPGIMDVGALAGVGMDKRESRKEQQHDHHLCCLSFNNRIEQKTLLVVHRVRSVTCSRPRRRRTSSGRGQQLAVNLMKDKEGRWNESMCKVLLWSLGKLHKIKTLSILRWCGS